MQGWHTIDWDKIQTMEDFKLIMSKALVVRIPEENPKDPSWKESFETMRHLLKPLESPFTIKIVPKEQPEQEIPKE